MLKIRFVEVDGTPHDVEAQTGISLMEAARDNGVPGIEAECGGCCACATCHVYIPDEWLAVTGTAEGEEKAMLEFMEGFEVGSRLSCQVQLTDALDGMVVKIPETQGF